MVTRNRNIIKNVINMFCNIFLKKKNVCCVKTYFKLRS